MSKYKTVLKNKLQVFIDFSSILFCSKLFFQASDRWTKRGIFNREREKKGENKEKCVEKRKNKKQTKNPQITKQMKGKQQIHSE